MQRISLGQALTAVPRVSPTAWRASSPLVRWLISARASVLVMTFASAALGGLLALDAPGWDPLGFWLCLLGLLLAHAANNQLNDLTDSMRGIDQGNYFRIRYGAHVLEQGLMSRRGLLLYILFAGGLAGLIGLYLIFRIGPALLAPFCLGGVFLLFYTWPMKQWGLGELAVLLVWGPLMVGGAHLAAAGFWSWQVAGIGLVYALGPTAVIFGKHVDKLDFDRAKGVATLPVRLGERTSRGWVRAMLAAQYLGCLVLVLAGWLPWPVLMVVLALPRALRADRVFARPAPGGCPPGYPEDVWPLWYAAHAFDHTRWFSLLFLAGLVLAAAAGRAGFAAEIVGGL